MQSMYLTCLVITVPTGALLSKLRLEEIGTKLYNVFGAFLSNGIIQFVEDIVIILVVSCGV